MRDLTNESNPDLLLKLNAFMSEKAVMEATTLSRSSLYRKRSAGEFPEPEVISDGRMGYRMRDIEAWLRDPLAWPTQGNSPGI